MEPDDLLAHEMHVGGPVFVQIVIAVVFEAQGGHVVKEGVDPYIDHMARVKVHRHAPGEAGPGHAQVLQTGIDEVADHLVDPAPGLQIVRVHQQVPDPVGVLGQPEEVGFFLRILDLPAAVGAFAVLQLALGPEALAGLAVFALISSLVDVAVVVHLPEDFLDGGHMIVVGGADEPVVGNVHQLPQVLNALGAGDDLVHELLGGDPGGFGLVLDFLAMLVGAGQEHHIIALKPLIAGHGVRGHGAVGVADVQPGRRVVNGGRDVKLPLGTLFAHNFNSSSRKKKSPLRDLKGDRTDAVPPCFAGKNLFLPRTP